jgi:hypothetical protein
MAAGGMVCDVGIADPALTAHGAPVGRHAPWVDGARPSYPANAVKRKTLSPT